MSSTSLPAAPQDGPPPARTSHEESALERTVNERTVTERTLVLRILEHSRPHQEPRFTISVCERSGLRAICHIRPLPGALLSLAPELSSVAMATNDAPDWSAAAKLVRVLDESADENGRAAADWLETAFAWAIELGQKFRLAQDRIEILDLLVQEFIKLAPLTAITEGQKVLDQWLQLVATYEGRQDLAPHIELTALREAAHSMAETVATMRAWLAGAAAPEGASIVLWRTESILRALGYQVPVAPTPPPWAAENQTTAEAQR